MTSSRELATLYIPRYHVHMGVYMVYLNKFKLESLKVVEDYIHVLVSATPQHTIPNMVKVLNRSTSKAIHRKPEC